MKNKYFVSSACPVALFLVLIGCGGGGSSTSGGSTTSGSDNATLNYELTGFTGKLVNDVSQSNTPQTVQVTVNGVVRTIPNVIVAQDIEASFDIPITVLSQGSKLLNCTIANPSGGAVIGDSSFKAPISADGVLQASVLAGSAGLSLACPSSTWQGYSLPNGFSVAFRGANSQGDQHVLVNSTIKFPKSVGSLSGTTSISYTSPSAFNADLTFTTGDFSQISVSGHGVAATNGTLTADWHSNRAGSGAPIFTSALSDNF